MDSVLIDDLVTSECKISVWDQGKSNCVRPIRPSHSMSLVIANGKRNPWFSKLEFASREQWFKFVRLVNKVNRLVKKLPKDEHGFPVLQE